MRSGTQEPVVAPNVVPRNSAKFIREDRATAVGQGRLGAVGHRRLDAVIRHRFVNERRTRRAHPRA
ncbi:MAG: hypothetical protein JWO79_5085 [Actinomycetia bacterium]|jgi:hypothetical protein|nr:hypothetical protein [Actinomycetes bacterium]MDQ1651924.1 hypothetical protein [Cryptosporangiaceae bacterium]